MKKVSRVFGRTGIIIGLLVGAGIIWFYEMLIPEEIEYPELHTGLQVEETLAEKQLTLTEMMPAIFAWHYFQNNTDSVSGMFRSYDSENIVNTNDIPGYVLAVFSARKLGIISKEELTERVISVLNFLSTVPLTEDGNFFTTYTLDSISVHNNYECDIFTSLRLTALMSTLVVNNDTFREPAFRLLKEMNLVSRLTDFRNKSEVPGIDGRVINLYIKSLQLPDSLNIISAAEFTRYPLDFTNYFHYLEQNIKYWGTDRLRKDYLDCEDVFYHHDSSYVVFSPLSLGKNEELYYYMSEDSAFTVYSKKMIPVEQTFVTTSGAFYRKLLRDDEIATRIIAEVNDLFDPERGWYEGRLINSGDVVTFINAHTNAVVLNVLCLSTYQNYY